MSIPSRLSLVQEVADGITTLIKENQYVPGDKLPNEFELAEHLNVARSTVREAVKMLVSRNVLEIRRGRGTYIADNPGLAEDPWGLSLAKDKLAVLVQLLELRSIIEPKLAMLAALRATDEEITAITEACARTEAAIKEGVPHNEHDLAFHLAIAEASHNEIAAKILQQIFAQSIDDSVELNHNRLLDETVETHAMAANGIAAHDADMASRGMQLHLEYNILAIKQLQEASSSDGE